MRTILLQLDTSVHASVFDAVVAFDSGAEHILRHGGVTPDNVAAMVHGLMFTRGPDDLRNSAIYIGGDNVQQADAVAKVVLGTLFDPLRVSVMIDPNGSNTTAAAAVLCARKYLQLNSGLTALVLGATGPVGQRVVQHLARQKVAVLVGSRTELKAQQICTAVGETVTGANLTPLAFPSSFTVPEGVGLVIAAGAAGVQLLGADGYSRMRAGSVLIDLNAVAPAGIEGINVGDKAKDRSGLICYGAIGVGGLKMKIHKACLAQLFTANNLVFDTQQIYDVGAAL